MDLFQRRIGEWRIVNRWFKVRLIDGNYARGKLFRRKVMGEWQYRALTKDEAADDFQQHLAW